MTPKQVECLAAIKKLTTVDGISPSYDELAAELGIASKSGICRLLDALEEQGKVRRGRQRSRRIEVIEEPGSREAIIRRVVALAMKRHGVDDPDGVAVVLSPDELEAVLRETI